MKKINHKTYNIYNLKYQRSTDLLIQNHHLLQLRADHSNVEEHRTPTSCLHPSSEIVETLHAKGVYLFGFDISLPEKRQFRL